MEQKDNRSAPAFIEFKGFKFLILDRPTDLNIPYYILELKKHHVKNVVRVCEPKYKVGDLKSKGIKVKNLAFKDGTSPSLELIDAWFEFLKNVFREDPGTCVAIHCVAGLGRAPLMVAIALIELGMKYENAVEMIRQKRRGAINAKQIAFLEKYKPKSRLKLKDEQKYICCVQ